MRNHLDRGADVHRLHLDESGSIGVLFTFMVLLTDITGDSSRHLVPLPCLSGMGDYLKNIIVLPRNQDAANVTVLDLKTNEPLAACIVTKETGFRLQEGNCSLPTIRPGLALVSSVQTTIMIYFEGNSLILPVIEELGKEYLLITASPDEKNETFSSFFIYPSKLNMSLRVCHRHSDMTGDRMNNFPPNALPIPPKARSCSYIELINYEGLVLNDIPSLRGTEISANFPFGVLEWYNVNASHDCRHRLPSTELRGQLSPIFWHNYPPLKAWGHTIMLPPLEGDRRRKLILIPESANADIFVSPENDNTTTLKHRKNNTTEIDSGGWVYINSTERVLFRYMLEPRDGIRCWAWQYMMPLEVYSKSDFSMAPIYQWIFIPFKTSLSVVCGESTKSSSSVFDTEQKLEIQAVSNVSDKGYSLKLYNLIAGLYSFHFDTDCFLFGNDDLNTFVMFPLYYKPSSKFQNNARNLADMKINNSTYSRATIINASDGSIKPPYLRNSTMFGRNVTGDHLVASSVTESRLAKSMNGNTTPARVMIYNSVRKATKSNTAMVIKETSKNNKTTDRLSSESDERVTNLTALLYTEGLVTTPQTTVQSSSHSVMYALLLQNENQQRTNINDSATQESYISNQSSKAAISSTFLTTTRANTVTLPDQPANAVQIDVSDKKTDVNAVDDLISNERFNEVVDIIHNDGEHMDSESFHTGNHITVNSQKHPSYVHKADHDDHYLEIHTDKSLMAIVISLCTALIAVVGIIVIFLLIEFFSRRRQIRKTRIRPFVSYY